jgi:hypothetical protein
LNEPDPLVKYNLNWSQVEVREYIRRLYFLTQYGGTLIRDGSNWLTRVHTPPQLIGSLGSGDLGYGNSTPESSIDSAIGASDHVLEANYRAKIRDQIRADFGQDGETPGTKFRKFVIIYTGGLAMGFLIGWAVFLR